MQSGIHQYRLLRVWGAHEIILRLLHLQWCCLQVDMLLWLMLLLLLLLL